MHQSDPDSSQENTHGQATESFYERMDEMMRAVWGFHLHHGLWTKGAANHEEAACRLVDEVGRRLGLSAGSRVIDVGCGYGATGVRLTEHFGVKVEGVTISGCQERQAVQGSRVTKGDWLAGFGDDGAADGVIAIESLEHMADTAGAVKHLARVLRPNGRLVLACWVRSGNPTWLERVWLLNPIREVSHLPGQATEEALLGMLKREGFRNLESEEMSEEAAPTWSACFGRGMRLLLSKPGLFRRLGWWASCRFGAVCLRVWFAYQLGLLRYVVITATR